MLRSLPLRAAPPTTFVLLALVLLLAQAPAAPAKTPQTIEPAWAKSVNWSGASDDGAADLALSGDGKYLWACGRTTAVGAAHADIGLVRIPVSGLRVYRYSWDSASHRADVATALAIAADGSIYTAGNSETRLTGSDIVLVKWSRLGKVLRVGRYSASKYADGAVDVVVDRSGNVTVCGTVGGLTGSDWVTIRWSADGTRKWVRTFTGSGGGNDSPSEMTVDRDGYVYVTGSEWRSDGRWGSRTIKYSPKGARLWSRSWSARGSASCSLGSITRRAAGGVYVGGSEEGGGAVVLRYTANGAVSRVVTGSTYLGAPDMATTSDGGWVLGGGGQTSPYVERYSSLGKMLKSWTLTPANDPEYITKIARVAADTAGRVYWAGHATANSDLIVGCRGRSGTASNWDGAWDDAGYQPVAQAAVCSGGALYVAGSHGTAAAGTDMFVLKYRP
jgi:hypothetical protein